MESSVITPASRPQCPLNLADWQDDISDALRRQAFQPSKNVKWFHESWYRFGRSSDLMPFILEQKGAHSEYMIGLFATILITGTVLIFWMGLLVLLSHYKRHKLPNAKKRGDIYRSITENEILLEYQQDEREFQYFGRPFRKPLPPREPVKPLNQQNQDNEYMSLTPQEKRMHDERMQEYNRDFRRYQSDLLDWKAQYKSYKRQIRCSRLTVILGCLVVILSSTLFYIRGAKQLIHAAQSSQHTLLQLHWETQQEMDRIQSFLDNSRTSNITTILDHTNTYCPLKRPRICSSSMLAQESCDWTGIPYSSSIQGWTSTLIHYQTNLTLRMYDFQHDLANGQAEIDSWISFLTHFQNGLLASFILVFGLDALCVYILIGVAVTYTKRRYLPQFFVWIRSYCLIPLFALLVVCGWIFASTFTLASLTTSDFCFNGPTEKVLALLHTANLSTNLDALIRQYVTGCSNAFSVDVFGSDITRLVQSVREAKLLQSNLIIFAANDDMRRNCGPFSESILAGTANLTEDELCSVAAILHESRKHMACSQWDPIYTSMTQEVVCTNAMDAFAWITISQLVIVFVSMMILTFRVAILPVQYVRWQPRAKALSKQVAADLKKISGLAQAMSEERLKQARIEPVYQLGYGGSSNSNNSGTAESVSDYYAEVSTTEPSYSDASNTATSEQTRTKIAPKMLDDDEGNHKGPKVKLLVSAHQTVAPIMVQSIQEGMDEDNDEHDDNLGEMKPESISIRSESIPPASERSMISGTGFSTTADSDNKPESYSESIPASMKSMTTTGSSIDDTKPHSTVQVLFDNGAPVRNRAVTDESSFEEFTIRSESEFDEATYYSKSNPDRGSERSLAELSADGSKIGNSRKSMISVQSMQSIQSAQSRQSGQSRGSERFLSSLEDVAEESPLHLLSPNPKLSPFAPGNAFMDHLLSEEKTANKGVKKPAKTLSLPVELSGKSRYPVDTSSVGASDTNSQSMDVDVSDPIDASTRQDESGTESGLGTSRKLHDNPKQSSRSLKNIDAVKAAARAKGVDDSFHFSLNLDMDTFQSTDFGDFSSSEGSHHGSEIVEYEIIEEIILEEPESNLRRSASISALSVDPDDPAYKSFSSTDLKVNSSNGRASENGGNDDTMDHESNQNMLLCYTSDIEENENGHAPVDSKTGGQHNYQAEGDSAAPRPVDIHALQKRVESIRSLGSASGASRSRAGRKDRYSFDKSKKAESIRSMASGHSVAISVATANELQYYLDDDMGGLGGSGNLSFGNAMLPSRAIDSEMLAVVDETLMDDDEEQQSSNQLSGRAQMRNLARTLRPQTHGWRLDSLRSLGSGRSGRSDDPEGRYPARHILLQRGQEPSMLSVNSAMSDDFNYGGRTSMGSASRSSEYSAKKKKSIQSYASGPSVAISAATMNEKAFYLDDEHGGSSDSFGHAMLPSRAIDSEMLEIVDETWMEDFPEDQEEPSSKPAKSQSKPSSRLSGKQIFLQKGADSVRSLGMGSFSGGISDDYDISFEKPTKPLSGLSLGSGGRMSEFEAKKQKSVQSYASGPSIAISAATMDEKQFRLDDDLGGSSDSFGFALLPSRGMDSEMLAVVDETLAEDAPDSPSNRGKRILEIGTTKSDGPKMDSDPSLGEALERSAEMSLVDPFETTIEISAAR